MGFLERAALLLQSETEEAAQKLREAEANLAFASHEAVQTRTQMETLGKLLDTRRARS